MAIEMVRIPSETPNISNTDDFVGLRYAYGNQNGYVIGKGQECSYTISGSKFRINSGRLVLQGVECDIDANGVEITIDNVATKRYYTVYLQVNLATNETKILSIFDTTGYPAIEGGDDLTQSTTGTARMELYKFEATSGMISNVQKVMQSIKYIEDVTVRNAKNINGVEIIKDTNGILKIGDIVIPQRKLLWKGNISLPQTGYNQIDTSINLSNKKLCIEISRLVTNSPSMIFASIGEYIFETKITSNKDTALQEYSSISGEQGYSGFVTLYFNNTNNTILRVRGVKVKNSDDTISLLGTYVTAIYELIE